MIIQSFTTHIQDNTYYVKDTYKALNEKILYI